MIIIKYLKYKKYLIFLGNSFSFSQDYLMNITFFLFSFLLKIYIFVVL